MHLLRCFTLSLACYASLAQADRSAEIHLLLEHTETFQAEALAYEAERRHSLAQPAGDAPLLNLYFSTALDASLRVESLRISIDGSQVAQNMFDERDLAALTGGGILPVQGLRLPAGPHQLVAEFTVWHKDQKLLGRRVLDFNQSKQESWIELLLEDVPGQLFADNPAANDTPARRIELHAQLWEAPR